MTCNGPAGDHQGGVLGRFELDVGEERDGSPVYRQAHSREMPKEYNFLLYR